MNATAINQVDFSKVPESTQMRICAMAFQMSMRRRNDPERRARFEKWKKEQEGKQS